jgi:hypothetical protein
VLRGPCIVEDVDTTIFAPTGSSIVREAFGGFEVRL